MHSALLIIAVFVIGIFVMPVLIRLAPVLGLVDHPGHRRGHRHPTAVVGGVGIVIASLLLLAWQVVFSLGELWLWLCILPLFLIGFIDDKIELHYRTRFICHLLVGAVMVYLGEVQLNSLGNLLGLGPLHVGVMAAPLTMFAVASAVNSNNLIDGLDGLASGVALIPLLVVLPLCLMAGLDFQALVGMVFIAATLAFMLFNYPGLRGRRPRCFLGDAGSNVLGFVGVYLLIDLSQRDIIYPITALFILGWPLMDTAAVIVRRRSRGLSPTTAGRDHIHHLLLDAGFGRTPVVMLIQGANLLFALLGLVLMLLPESVSFSIYMLFLLSYLWFSRSPERVSLALQVRFRLPGRAN